MSTLEQDLANLNFEYLMLARESVRSNAMEAAWRFGLNSKQVSVIADLSVEKIKEMSQINRPVITLLPLFSPKLVTHTMYSALLIPLHSGEESA